MTARLLGLCVLVVVACSACGSPVHNNVSPRQAASNLLGSTGFDVREVDRATEPKPSEGFVDTFVGERTLRATKGTVVKTGYQPITYTLYATLTTYCHLGPQESGGGYCNPGNGNDDYLTFVSLGLLRSIAAGGSRVTTTGKNFSFSGSATDHSTDPPVTERWFGTGMVTGKYLSHLQYRLTDSLGGTEAVTATYSNIGTVPTIHPPSSLPN
jgi:hypothetical protein